MPADERFAVIGHPIAHSLSPRIHALFATQTGRRLRYSAIDVPPDALAIQVQRFFDEGGRGLNVTVPHKQAVMALLADCSAAARRAGAANTLWRDAAGALLGDNTDGIGLVRDLRDNLGVAIHARRVLLLGAGGAARGILAPLLAQGPAELLIANRDGARAAALVAGLDGPVRACALAELVDSAPGAGTGTGTYDLILNATAASLTTTLPSLSPSLIGAHSTCYDLAYAQQDTAFVTWARRAGAAAAYDGLGMLVEQAAESFWLWHGIRPQTAPVLAQLRPRIAAR